MPKKQSRLISKGKDADIVTLTEVFAEISATETFCGHWHPTVSLISMEEVPANERGLVVCLNLDAYYDAPDKALRHAMRVAQSMNVAVEGDDVFRIYPLTLSGNESLSEGQYFRLYDDGSPLH